MSKLRGSVERPYTARRPCRSTHAHLALTMSSAAVSSRNFTLMGQPACVADGTNLRWEIRGPSGDGSSRWTSGEHPARPIDSTSRAQTEACPPGGVVVSNTVTDVRLMEPTPGLKACSVRPDPAPRLVKSGTRCAHQSHEEHALVESVGCGPHAGEAAELEMETLRSTRLDRPTGHQRRSQVRSISCSPGPRDGRLVWLDAIALQILERTIAGHCELVREGSELPALAAGVAPAHQCVAPIEITVASDVHVDTLIDSRVGKRDQRIPMAVQVSALVHVVRALEMSRRAVGRWMDLQRRLRGQPHACAAPDADDLLKPIVPEYTWSGRREDHVQAVTLGKPSSDAEWRLAISLGQHGPTVAVDEAELEPCVPSDGPGRSLVAMPRGRHASMQFLGHAGSGCSYSNWPRIHLTTSSSPTPLLRFVKTNGRSPRITFASRAMMSRLAPTCGARSILLITRRSERVTPGPPLRGILSPPETSMTYIDASTSSGLKLAARLSPPDSRNTMSRSACRVDSSSSASKFIEASSRMAVCGHPPVWTPMMRSSGNAWLRTRNSMSSRVKMSLVMTPSR